AMGQDRDPLPPPPTRKGRGRLCALLTFLLATTPALAQKSADTLRVVWRDALPNVDPYFNSARTGLIVAHQAFDTLLQRDPETLRLKPLLAQSWKWLDDRTLEFELHPGIRFHNGDPLTAADVAYTFNTISAPETRVSVPSNSVWIDRAEAVTDRTVRVTAKSVFPAAVEYIAMALPIWPKSYRERVGADEYAKHPVGAGPYRITRVDGVREIDFERFDDYYADSPKGRPAIRRLIIKEVPEEATQVSMLLGNQADWIWYFNTDNFDNIARVPTLQAVRAESMRYGFISLDAAGRTGVENPLTNLKVRQAIHYAIDRATIANTLVKGGARALDAPCYPTQFGCDQQAAVHYDYDPAKARQLLAEAGFKDGVETELVTSLLPQWATALQNYLGAVGIRARLTVLVGGAATQRQLEGKAPLYGNAWGSYSINDVSAGLPYFFSGDAVDYARDAEVTRLVREGGAVADPDARRRAYSAAIRRITEQAYFLPLWSYSTTYAFSRQLDFKPWPDELPRFYLASWK
ncbi:MAG TPA: ABC transporter substrate-binding protein, partial [Acetobacteraceae bacterium]|nr:ABC transporter substrate-binding protein [Acetobacteraceae bacterium]